MEVQLLEKFYKMTSKNSFVKAKLCKNHPAGQALAVQTSQVSFEKMFLIQEHSSLITNVQIPHCRQNNYPHAHLLPFLYSNQSRSVRLHHSLVSREFLGRKRLMSFFFLRERKSINGNSSPGIKNRPHKEKKTTQTHIDTNYLAP